MVQGRPTIWITVGQGPTALAVGAGGGCLILSQRAVKPKTTNQQPTVPHLLRLQQGRVTFSPLPYTTSLFKSPYHVRLKMTHLEIFQSSIIKNTTERYVDCSAVSSLAICS